MPSPPTYWRSPRLNPNLPQKEVEIEAPPSAQENSGSLLSILLPVIFMAGAMAILGVVMKQMGQSASMMLLFMIPMMLASSMASVVMYFSQKKKNEEKNRKRKHGYIKLLKRYAEELQTLQERQQEITYHSDPTPAECLERVRTRSKGLWGRSPGDEDYLAVRLGVCRQKSSVTVKVPRAQNAIDPDPLIKKAQEVADYFEFVPEMPLKMYLRQAGVSGITGAKDRVREAARAIIMQLATHHAPSEVKIVVVYGKSVAAEWAWVRWLPHIWNDKHQVRYIATDTVAAHRLFSYLDEGLDQRRQRLTESGSDKDMVFSPDYVVILDDSIDVSNEPFVYRLLEEGAELGFYPLFLRERSQQLPLNCSVYAKFDDERSTLIMVDESKKQSFHSDRVPVSLAKKFAHTIAPIRLMQAHAAEIPTSVSLLELFGVNRLEDLHVERRWQKSQVSGRSLATPIGVQRGGQLRLLDLHERKDGPNGLVAGMVGAGKSVLLESLVASLAINYHPYRVSFVLVDFKGGGMAKPFENMPHTLGVITNLQEGNLAVRALTSLRVEAERRQRLFDEAGVNHIDDYQKLYYKGKVETPLPYLVIIVDEFAEMKSEEPEVAKDFIKLARLGRALGVRLILAMQKPAGIVDGQIEANTRFRLCLRVAQAEDSRAMLKRPDAAYLAGNGRAYLQVGANEVFELFQVAWGGAPYDPEGLLESNPKEIYQIHLNGERELLYTPDRPVAREDISQLHAVTVYLARVAEEQGIEPLSHLWLPPLPKELSLDEVRSDEGWDGKVWRPVERWLAPVVGLVDNPSRQEQSPLRIKFGEEGGHLAVYGEPGSGKTTFIQTLITSLALSYSPHDVNIYIVDLGGRTLRMFESLPHVGGVVTADEEERFSRLLDFLFREMDRRRELFGEVGGVTTLTGYRRITGSTLPAFIVVIDNYANLSELHEDAEEKIIRLTRDGGNLGIHLVLTANNAASVRFRVSSNITMAVALNLVEKADYSAIVGRTSQIPAPVSGRGLVRRPQEPLEFQTALPGAGKSDLERNENLKKLMEAMASAWQGSKAKAIPVLPDVVPLTTVLSLDGSISTGNTYTVAVPIGLYVDDLTPFTIRLSDGPNFLITGPTQAGRTTFLQTWLLALAANISPTALDIYLFDSRRMGLQPLSRLPHVCAYANEQSRADTLLTEIGKILQEREKVLFVKDRAFHGSNSESSKEHTQPALVIVVDDVLDPFNDPISEQGKQLLAEIVRKGRGLGLYLIMSGMVSDVLKGWNEPVKSLKEAQVGVILGSNNEDIFGLRLPYKERDKIPVSGEGFWCHHGLIRRIKVATPHKDQLTLAEWVDRVSKLFERKPNGIVQP